jgi:hypothetical protein
VEKAGMEENESVVDFRRPSRCTPSEPCSSTSGRREKEVGTKREEGKGGLSTAKVRLPHSNPRCVLPRLNSPGVCAVVEALFVDGQRGLSEIERGGRGQTAVGEMERTDSSKAKAGSEDKDGCSDGMKERRRRTAFRDQGTKGREAGRKGELAPSNSSLSPPPSSRLSRQIFGASMRSIFPFFLLAGSPLFVLLVPRHLPPLSRSSPYPLPFHRDLHTLPATTAFLPRARFPLPLRSTRRREATTPGPQPADFPGTQHSGASSLPSFLSGIRPSCLLHSSPTPRTASPQR